MAWFKMPEIDEITLRQVARAANLKPIEIVGVWCSLHDIAFNSSVEGQIATAKGIPLTADDVADVCGITGAEASAIMQALVDARLLTLNAGLYALTETAEAPSPAVLRMRKHRAKRNGDVTSDAHVTHALRNRSVTSLSSSLSNTISLSKKGEGSVREEGEPECLADELFALTCRQPSQHDLKTSHKLMACEWDGAHEYDYDHDIATAALKLCFKETKERDGRDEAVRKQLSYFAPAIVRALECGTMPGQRTGKYAERGEYD